MTLFFLGMAFIVAGGAGALCCGRRASSPQLRSRGLTAERSHRLRGCHGSIARKNPSLFLGIRRCSGSRLWDRPAFGLFSCLSSSSCRVRLYGIGYLEPQEREKRGPSGIWYDLLAAGMVGVLAARDFLSLAVCWSS
jgi:hypothetical protein